MNRSKRADFGRRGQWMRRAVSASANATVVLPGAKLKVTDGQEIRSENGDMIVEWDPYTVLDSDGGRRHRAVPATWFRASPWKTGSTNEPASRRRSSSGYTSSLTAPLEDKSTKTVKGKKKSAKTKKEEASAAQPTPRISIKDAEGKTVKLERGQEARFQLPVAHPPIEVVDGDEIHARRHSSPRFLARDDEDEGHHRWSSSRRRALRGSQAQGVRRSSARSTVWVDFGKDTKGKRKISVVRPDVGRGSRVSHPQGQAHGVPTQATASGPVSADGRRVRTRTTS